MRVTCILNLKGGVAKTTTAINMAAILAADYEKRVLVVDADSQCNTTEFLGVPGKTVWTLADMLRGTECAAQASNVDGVELIPADDSLMDLDLSSTQTKGLDIQCIKKLCKGGAWDYVLIDCPPAFNAATAAALIAADDVIIPIKLDAFSLRGMANLMRQIKNMRQINPRLTVAGLLPTMYYQSQKMSEAKAALAESGLPFYPPIRRTGKVDDMTFAQRPIIESSPRSAAAKDYRRFVECYVEREAGGRQVAASTESTDGGRQIAASTESADGGPMRTSAPTRGAEDFGSAVDGGPMRTSAPTRGAEDGGREAGSGLLSSAGAWGQAPLREGAEDCGVNREGARA